MALGTRKDAPPISIMIFKKNWPRFQTLCAAGVLSLTAIVWTASFLTAQTAGDPETSLEASFEAQVKPFFQQNCIRCHNTDVAMSGVRLDQLDASLDDRHIRFWEAARKRIGEGSMPPKGMKQPTAEDREKMVSWITSALETARTRTSPKNGLVRRLTVAQYRNTLRELLLLEDDVSEALPPDAISRDGFVNNTDTLQLSPLQLESYFDIAGEALKRSIVDPSAKPRIQHFRMDLGAGVNPNPFPEELILGAGSALLENADILVTEPQLTKPFSFEPIRMRTKYRFIEGYKGNATVRGWREYDSIYHAVFADMRGKGGYPKGDAYGLVPEGLLLRPAIPNDGFFGVDGTYGPSANFKISLRELPDHGRFRVTVTAAKYNDGLLLYDGAPPKDGKTAGSVAWNDPGTSQTLTVPKAGLYQVDVHAAAEYVTPVPDSSRLSDGLAASWPMDGELAGAEAPTGGSAAQERFVESPFGKALSLVREAGGPAVITRTEAMNVGEGDFTVAAWIHPRLPRRGGIVSLGQAGGVQGWYLEVPGNKGVLQIQTTGADNQSNGGVVSPPGVIRGNAWQHVAAVVRRGKNETWLYVNGYPVARGTVGPANLDNPKMNLHLGNVPEGQAFRGEIDEVRLYRRALGEAEVQALVEPGRQFVRPPPEQKQEVTLTLGKRQFSGTLEQPAFLAVRLEAGPLRVRAEHKGFRKLERIVITPLGAAEEAGRRFLAFEKRSPRVGVHLGLRRDCGSSLAPVGEPQTVTGTSASQFVFEGAIRNFPSPDVEKDNVNYLAGIREIGVHSEYTDGRDMPRLLIRSVAFEGPFYETWPPASHRSIFVDFNRKDDQPAYATEIIRRFATRAYRRPVTPAEQAAAMAVYTKSREAGRSFPEGIQDALQVVLTSPQFLFLIEQSSTPAPEPLNGYELASKLSYFLWNGPPDRTTLRLAGAGTLSKQLNAEVERMIQDPRFSRFTREFASQWLSLEKFSVLEPDRKRYPQLTRDTSAQLAREPVQFVEHLIRNNLPVRNLIQSDFVVANEVVANYYGLGDKTESGFQFVAIPHGRPELGGVLTQAAIMAGLSDGRESNPVKRGAWLARKIIAEPPADPPPNVPALKEDPTQKLTLRQRIERHRNQPGCQQCHSMIDPWGVPFEEFDAGGRLKKEPVDAQSQLPDKTNVGGVNDLKRYLAEDRLDQVAFSVLRHMATYATGRTLKYNEVSQLKQDGLKLKASGYRMKDMIEFVVNSKMFLEK
ncbi:MAG: DUF1592 domain-containing protein [Bryobacteraceae bacterium]